MSREASGAKVLITDANERIVVLLVAYLGWDALPIQVSLERTFNVLICVHVHVLLYLLFTCSLVRLGVGRSFVGWFPSFLTSRWQAVYVDRVYSSMFHHRVSAGLTFLSFFDDSGRSSVDAFHAVR